MNVPEGVSAEVQEAYRKALRYRRRDYVTGVGIGEPLRGGKPVILYVFGQTFNIILTFIMAWLMFMVIFRDITERLMLGA